MNRPAKQYPLVGPVEKVTGLCPLYLAFTVTDEVRQYCQADLPDGFSDQLAARAETVFAHNDFWRRKIKGRQGRNWLLACMRHWLSALLCRQRPDLFQQLPSSFQIGHPLPLRHSRQNHNQSQTATPTTQPCAQLSTSRATGWSMGCTA
jgi:hypothetical protein